MPINNFKLFDEKKANMMSDDDYAINQQRLNGVQSGVASSQLQNKTLYQTALMCYALAQLMAANGYDANDANAVSTFVNNLSRSMVQKVVDKASANDVESQTAGKWVDAKQLGELKANIADNYLPLLGGTMLGDLILNRDPVSSLQSATKQYVDKKIEIITLKTINFNSSENVKSKVLGEIIDLTFADALLIEIKFNTDVNISPQSQSSYITLSLKTNMFKYSNNDVALLVLNNSGLDGKFDFAGKSQTTIIPLCIANYSGCPFPFYIYNIDSNFKSNYINMKLPGKIKENTHFNVEVNSKTSIYDFDVIIKTLKIK